MREHNEYVARVVACEQSAKNARTESEKQSWLVMADSWRETVKLQETLARQAEFIREVPMQRPHA
jgi:antitoxin (DNA-binding transcriptional repressor) of toxin-antitoxin stability system